MSNTPFDWANDTNYPAGAKDWSATPTKVAPTEGAYVTPEEPFAAQHFNYLMDKRGDEIRAVQNTTVEIALQNGVKELASHDNDASDEVRQVMWHPGRRSWMVLWYDNSATQSRIAEFIDGAWTDTILGTFDSSVPVACGFGTGAGRNKFCYINDASHRVVYGTFPTISSTVALPGAAQHATGKIAAFYTSDRGAKTVAAIKTGATTLKLYTADPTLLSTWTLTDTLTVGADQLIGTRPHGPFFAEGNGVVFMTGGCQGTTSVDAVSARSTASGSITWTTSVVERFSAFNTGKTTPVVNGLWFDSTRSKFCVAITHGATNQNLAILSSVDASTWTLESTTDLSAHTLPLGVGETIAYSVADVTCLRGVLVAVVRYKDDATYFYSKPFYSTDLGATWRTTDGVTFKIPDATGHHVVMGNSGNQLLVDWSIDGGALDDAYWRSGSVGDSAAITL